MTTATVSAPRPSPGEQPGAPAPGYLLVLPAVPVGVGGGPRALVARALLRRAATRLPVRIQVPDGSVSGGGGPGSPVLVIRDEDAFYRRLGAGTAGLAESYMAGDWDSGGTAQACSPSSHST